MEQVPEQVRIINTVVGGGSFASFAKCGSYASMVEVTNEWMQFSLEKIEDYKDLIQKAESNLRLTPIPNHPRGRYREYEE